MADYTPAQNEGVRPAMRTRYKDMNDGTHALVVWAEPTSSGSSGGAVAVCDTWRIAGTDESLWVDADYTCHVEFPVPANQEWHILYVSVYASTVQMQEGARYIQVLVTENDIIQSYLAVSQVAIPDNTEEQWHIFGAGCADQIMTNACEPVQTPLPNGTMLHAGQNLLVRYCYNCNIGDFMRVHLQYAWRTV